MKSEKSRINSRRPCLFILALFVGSLCISSCKPTYPKEGLTRSLEQLIRKEHHLRGRAYLTGKTLYLTIELPELATTEAEVPKASLKKLQGAVLSIVRASLSSDAKIRFLVVTATVPDWKLRIRIIQMVDDIKGFLYQRISKADYEERMILDIVPEEAESGLAFEDEADLSTEKFISLLIVSQVNKLNRMNPFVGAVLRNGQLRYQDIVNGNLFIKITDQVPASIGAMWKDIVGDQAKKILAKYRIWYPHTIVLIDRANQAFVVVITK